MTQVLSSSSLREPTKDLDNVVIRGGGGRGREEGPDDKKSTD